MASDKPLPCQLQLGTRPPLNNLTQRSLPARVHRLVLTRFGGSIRRGRLRICLHLEEEKRQAQLRAWQVLALKMEERRMTLIEQTSIRLR
jgi:hypothetical protein